MSISQPSVASPLMGDCSCKCARLPTMRKQWSVSCACSCARSRARSCSSGTARLSIADMRSKTFGSSGAAKRLHLEQLPGYAPDLNPDEGIWNYLKRVELGNVCCRDLQHLSTELIRARERLRHKREVIRSCSQQCGYSV